MPVFTLSPLADTRWDELVSRHPSAGVFHTSNWLSALERTYGYEPIAFTTSGPGEPLRNGLVFCRVKSWVTGRRLVSLPFSDHCALLADSEAEREELIANVCERVVSDHYAHAEIRAVSLGGPSAVTPTHLGLAETFYWHRLSLDAPLDTLFHNLHRNCIQRKIRRAEREELIYESGHSESLLRKFYHLLTCTRRRHSLPPQPMQWFRNLVESMGNALTIRLVSKEYFPVAALLTLSHKTTVVYKYGGSDERFHNLGGTPFLFWKTIQEAKNQGMRELDLGRSDFSHVGLVQFKDRMGAVRTMLPYWRYPAGLPVDPFHPSWQILMAKKIFSWIPDRILVASGRLLYRHIG